MTRSLVMPLRDIVFVIGMSRSGTSALARVLSLCGGAIPLEVLPPNFANPTGYWEPRRAVEINEAFLNAHGSSWDDPGMALQLSADPAALGKPFVAQIVDVLETGFEPAGPIILKDPRITTLLPYWVAAAGELRLRPVFIHVYRNPADVAASLTSRDGLPVDRSLALWLKWNLIGERDTRGMPRIFIAYEDLMRSWRSVVASCINELGIDVACTLTSSLLVEAFLSRALHHHRSSPLDEGDVDGTLLRWVARLYSVLRHAHGSSVRASVFDRVLHDYVTLRGSDTSRLDSIA